MYIYGVYVQYIYLEREKATYNIHISYTHPFPKKHGWSPPNVDTSDRISRSKVKISWMKW